ncbi:hypothetical protein PO909_024136 [Leuciscus waleckii]
MPSPLGVLLNSPAKGEGRDPETGDPGDMPAALQECVSAPLLPPEEGRVENLLFRFVSVPPKTQNFNKREVSTSPGSHTVETGSSGRRSIALPLPVFPDQEGQNDSVRCHIASLLSFPSHQRSDDSDATRPRHSLLPLGKEVQEPGLDAPGHRSSFPLFPSPRADEQLNASVPSLPSAPSWKQVGVALHTQTLLPPASVPPESSPCLPPRCPTPGTLVVRVGSLVRFFEAWLALPRLSRWLNHTIRLGYAIQFARRPPKFRGVRFTHVRSCDAPVLRKEIDVLLAKDAIEPVPPAEMRSGFYSPYFIVPKKGGGL